MQFLVNVYFGQCCLKDFFIDDNNIIIYFLTSRIVMILYLYIIFHINKYIFFKNNDLKF